jgi:hypothetical protein
MNLNGIPTVPQFRRSVVGFPPRRLGFELGSVLVGFVVDKAALEQVLSKYFGFPCQLLFNRLLYNHHYHLSSGAGIIGQIVAAVQSGLSPKKFGKNISILITSLFSKLYQTKLYIKREPCIFYKRFASHRRD